MLRSGSREILLRKLNALAEEFSELYREDVQSSVAERRHYGMVIAFRPWVLPEFRSLANKVP